MVRNSLHIDGMIRDHKVPLLAHICDVERWRCGAEKKTENKKRRERERMREQTLAESCYNHRSENSPTNQGLYKRFIRGNQKKKDSIRLQTLKSTGEFDRNLSDTGLKSKTNLIDTLKNKNEKLNQTTKQSNL